MKFWEIRNSGSTNGELLLYGEIRSEKPWWDDDSECITKKEFMQDMTHLKSLENLTIRISSIGGDLIVAQEIYAQLKQLKANKTVIIEGIAASAATIIIMAGDTVKITSNSVVMIHEPSLFVYGHYDKPFLERFAEMLTTIRASAIEVYRSKLKCTESEISEMMEKETWLTAKQAVELGFADKILDDQQAQINMRAGNTLLVVNGVQYDIRNFKNVPVFNHTEDQKEAKKNEVVLNMTIEELKQQYTDLIVGIENNAKQSGIAEERERIENIEKIANTINPELVNKAKFETPMDAKELAFQNSLLAANKGAVFMQNLKSDSEISGTNDVGSLPDSPTNKEINNITGLQASLAKDGRRV